MEPFQRATPADGDDILSLFRNTPQRGRVVLNFEREPDYFRGGQVICEKPEVHIARRVDGALMMLYGMGTRTLYINGAPRPVRYAHDLRLAEQARGGRMILRMARYVGEMIQPDEIMQTVILTENSESMNSVASGRAGLPTYYPCGDIETSLIFRVRRPSRCTLTVRQAGISDIARMQQFHDRYAPQRQFYPRYEFAAVPEGHPYYHGQKISDYWLAFQGDDLVGMAGLWDQKSFKQTRVLAYPRGLSGLRHLWNLWAALAGGLHLPPAGGTMRYLMLHAVLVRDDDPAVLQALLVPMAQQAASQQAAISAGFFLDDPLRKTMRACRRQTMSSRHFLIGYHGDSRAQLDDRRGYIELARL
jgi:hypothetical protein